MSQMFISDYGMDMIRNWPIRLSPQMQTESFGQLICLQVLHPTKYVLIIKSHNHSHKARLCHSLTVADTSIIPTDLDKVVNNDYGYNANRSSNLPCIQPMVVSQTVTTIDIGL